MPKQNLTSPTRQPANRGRLKHGMVYEGRIHSCNYTTMTYVVVLLNGETVEGVRDGSGLFCGLLGLKTTQRLSPGTLVILAKDSTSWIIGTGAADIPDKVAHLSRTITGKGLKDAVKISHPNDTNKIPEHNMAEDLYEGEVEITGLLGGFIRFLTFMTSLGTNERNQIEFHLLRDMTRLMSHNFEHFSCNGDRKIYDDGRLNEEENITNYDHERMGALDPSSEKTPVKEALLPEDLDPLRTGRWRYTQVRGFIGDFINRFVSDPTEIVGNMAVEAVRAGKWREHIGQDGTYLMESVAEIAFEKRCRVLVPIRIKHEEDPSGVLREEMNELEKNFLKVWDQGGGKTEHHTIFQIREYVRYLNQYHSLARIHQLAAKKGEWYIPSEADTPAPDVNGKETDRESANQGAATYWKEAYATIRIMKDGSILTFDAYGNMTASGPYGIHHSSIRHHHTYAAGDIVRKAGGSIFDSARRHVEIVASRGGIALKGRTFFRGLCERGTLWLKSDYDPDTPYTPQEAGDPEAESVGRQGVRIQATKGETRWISWLKSRFLVTKPVTGEGVTEDFEFGSGGAMKFSSAKNTGFEIGENLMMTVKKDVHWISNKFLARVQHLSLPGMASFKPGKVVISNLSVSTLEASGRISGPLRFPQVSDSIFNIPLRPHLNHIDAYAGLKVELPEEDPPEPVSYSFSETDGAYWELLPSSEYLWNVTGPKEDTDHLYEPLTQQQLRLDTPEEEEAPEGYMVWANGTDALLDGSQTAAGSKGWPGSNRQWLRHNPSCPTLSTPTSRAPASFTANTQTGLTLGTVEFRVLRK